MKALDQKLKSLSYALYSRFAGVWRTKTFLFGLARMLGIPHVGKNIAPQARDFLTANILVIRPDVLGDVLLTLPFLSELKRRLPKARITLAVARPWAKFVEQLQIVDAVVEYPLDASPWHAASNVFRALSFGRKTLKKMKLDLVLCPRWDADFHDTHLVAFFSYAAQRITFFADATPWKAASNRGRDAFYTHVVADQVVRHEAERSLCLLETLGLQSPTGADSYRSFSIRNKVSPTELKLEPSWKGLPLIGIFPGVRDPEKQWPVENFITAAKKIADSRPVRFLVFGTENESVQCEHFSRELSGSALNLCGNTDLMELAGSLRLCSTVITCDSGGAHLAGVLEVPVAVIFRHPTGGDPASQLSPERFGPLGKYIRILQPGTNNPSPVTAEQVAQAALELISEKSK